ncbi:MAG TPA: glycosyltransferase family 4 protein [Terracidiphilus sp.]|nr:glycosyltransferase family 4 protein [Terracidiphilus sp.]
MKIALCAPADLHALAQMCGQPCDNVAAGLGSTATTPLIGEFLRRGHEITLYTLSKDVTEKKVYHWQHLRIVVGPFRQHHLAATYFWPEINFLERTIRKDAPKFVHAHWTYEFALGALRSGVPTLTTIHDLPWKVLWYYRDAHRAIRLLMAYEVALRGTHFTAVSQSAAKHFVRAFKPGATIQVVPNGLADEVFALGDHARQRNGRAITFATVLQGWSRRKNAKTALEAFAIARRQLTNARLIQFGEGYEPEGEANRFAAAHGLDRDVIFAGPVPHETLLRRLREEVDVVVHPSLDEAFSMAALEALALRKALIAGETTPGMREMLGPSGGVLIDVRHPAPIAQAMCQLALNDNYRLHLANRSFERVREHYRLGAAAACYENLYRQLFRTQSADVCALKPRLPIGLDA